MPSSTRTTSIRRATGRLLVAAALASALVASPLAAADRGQETAEGVAERPIADVTADVSRALGNYRYDDIFDWIEARVEGDTVLLSGSVYQGWKRDSIAKRVQKVDGVAEVVNEIEVLPVSGFDDQIRYQIARSIYGSHAFFGRSYWVSPPIHILVSKGRVTLEGVVNNEAERVLARSLASRSPLSIGKIENNLVLARDIAR